MKIREIIDALEEFAPLPLQESYDNAGLQVGLTESDVSGALLCLDVTEDVIADAIGRGCNLIISHHPVIFRGLKQLGCADYVQRAVWQAVKNDICIVSMHTNLDNAPGGVNYRMAEKLRLKDVQFLAPLANGMKGGSGIIGSLEKEMDAEEFVKCVKKVFGVECCMTNELLQRPVKRVALCGGAGSFLLGDAIKAKADAFITGEMHYHDYFGHNQQIQIAVIGHYESEQYTVQLIGDILKERFPQLQTYCYGSTNPIRYW